jgi:hypothetical protein
MNLVMVNSVYPGPGVYDRDPVISLIDYDEDVGTCNRVGGFNDTAIYPEGRANVDLRPYRRTDSNTSIIILILLGLLLFGYLPFIVYCILALCWCVIG